MLVSNANISEGKEDMQNQILILISDQDPWVEFLVENVRPPLRDCERHPGGRPELHGVALFVIHYVSDHIARAYAHSRLAWV